jgi:hypothetical protein
MGKTTVELDITISTLGTCTSTLFWTLPNTPNSSGGMGGREMAVNGKTFSCGFTGTNLNCSFSDVSSFAANERFVLSGAYENQ